MKTFKINILLLSALLLISVSCEDKIVREYIANTPVYLSYDQLAESVVQSDSRDLNNPGKLYFKDDYIFIIEALEGIHIIDNSDPANPTNLSFIEIPGVVDMAIKGTNLYADSYVDLVTLNIADINNISETHRNKNVFQYILPPYDNDYPIANVDQEKGVVIAWEIKTVREEIEQINYYPHYYGGMYLAESDSWLRNSASGVSGSGFGIGGSMARFGLTDDVLYSVDNSKLWIFKLDNPQEPNLLKDYYIGWNIETMFLTPTHMFLGTQNGMEIFDISNNYSPMYISRFWHVTSCDPVVIKDDKAYITLRDGNDCGSTINELNIVSIADIENPELIKRYGMTNPHGLSIDGTTLFLCDGDDGLKIYDITDPLTVTDNKLAEFSDINTFDVIAVNGVLLLVGEDGFYQYDYSDLQNIELLSKIEVVHNN